MKHAIMVLLGATVIATAQPKFAFTNFAGQVGVSGLTNGLGSDAYFSGSLSIARDSAGNMFVGDYYNNAIRMITPDAVVTTVPGGSSGYNHPDGVVADNLGNLYVADQDNNRIRKITNGVASVFAGSTTLGTNDGTGTAARFYKPTGLAIDPGGNLYVADRYNHLIRRITPDAVVKTIAGLGKSGGGGIVGTNDGIGNAARFNFPTCIAVDGKTNLFVTDSSNHSIRKMTSDGTNWMVTTFAGTPGQSGTNDGTGLSAMFNVPRGMAFDSAGNLFVVDSNNHTVRMITPEGVVTTVAGMPGVTGSANGTNTDARFYGPKGIVLDDAGNMFVADGGNYRISKGVLLNAPSGPPAFSAASVAGGLFHLWITNSAPGSEVVLETSGNLGSWTPVSTNTSALIDVSDLISGQGQRFFRAYLRQ